MQTDPLIRSFSSSLQSAIDDFLLARQVEGRSAKTLRFYHQALGGFAAFVGSPPPSSLTVHVMRRYLAHLAESGLAAQSQHNYVVAVKGCLKWLSDEGDYALDAHWLDRIKAPCAVSRHRGRTARTGSCGTSSRR